MASFLGDISSEGYYAILLFGPFAIILILILLSRASNMNPKMPLTFLVTFLAMPKALKLIKKGKQRHNQQHLHDFIALDGATAQLNLLFGLLCTTALGFDVLINFLLG